MEFAQNDDFLTSPINRARTGGQGVPDSMVQIGLVRSPVDPKVEMQMGQILSCLQEIVKNGHQTNNLIGVLASRCLITDGQNFGIAPSEPIVQQQPAPLPPPVPVERRDVEIQEGVSIGEYETKKARRRERRQARNSGQVLFEAPAPALSMPPSLSMYPTVVTGPPMGYSEFCEKFEPKRPKRDSATPESIIPQDTRQDLLQLRDPPTVQEPPVQEKKTEETLPEQEKSTKKKKHKHAKEKEGKNTEESSSGKKRKRDHSKKKK